jgi:hypothetical protein
MRRWQIVGLPFGTGSSEAEPGRHECVRKAPRLAILLLGLMIGGGCHGGEYPHTHN